MLHQFKKAVSYLLDTVSRPPNVAIDLDPPIVSDSTTTEDLKTVAGPSFSLGRPAWVELTDEKLEELIPILESFSFEVIEDHLESGEPCLAYKMYLDEETSSDDDFIISYCIERNNLDDSGCNITFIIKDSISGNEYYVPQGIQFRLRSVANDMLTPPARLYVNDEVKFSFIGLQIGAKYKFSISQANFEHADLIPPDLELETAATLPLISDIDDDDIGVSRSA